VMLSLYVGLAVYCLLFRLELYEFYIEPFSVNTVAVVVVYSTSNSEDLYSLEKLNIQRRHLIGIADLT
jgi:hypothetical protein